MKTHNTLQPLDYIHYLLRKAYYHSETPSFFTAEPVSEFAQAIATFINTTSNQQSIDVSLQLLLNFISNFTYINNISSTDKTILGKFFAEFQHFLLALEVNQRQIIIAMTAAEIKGQLAWDLIDHSNGFPQHFEEMLSYLEVSDLVRVLDTWHSYWLANSADHDTRGLNNYDDDLFDGIITLQNYLNDYATNPPQCMFYKQLTRETYNPNSIPYKKVLKFIKDTDLPYLSNTLQLLNNARPSKTELGSFLRNIEITLDVFSIINKKISHANPCDFENSLQLETISILLKYVPQNVLESNRIHQCLAKLISFVTPQTRGIIFLFLIEKLAVKELLNNFNKLDTGEKNLLANKYISQLYQLDDTAYERYVDNYSHLKKLKNYVDSDSLKSLTRHLLTNLAQESENVYVRSLHSINLLITFMTKPLKIETAKHLLQHITKLSPSYQALCSMILTDVFSHLPKEIKTQALPFMLKIEMCILPHIELSTLKLFKEHLPEAQWNTLHDSIYQLAFTSPKYDEDEYAGKEVIEKLVGLYTESEKTKVFNAILSEIEKMNINTLERTIHMLSLFELPLIVSDRSYNLFHLFISNLPLLVENFTPDKFADMVQSINLKRDKKAITQKYNHELFHLYKRYQTAFPSDTLTIIIYDSFLSTHSLSYDRDFTLAILQDFISEVNLELIFIILKVLASIIRKTNTHAEELIIPILNKLLNTSNPQELFSSKLVDQCLSLSSALKTHEAKFICEYILEMLGQLNLVVNQPQMNTPDNFIRINFLQKLFKKYLEKVAQSARLELHAMLPNAFVIEKKMLFLTHYKPVERRLDLDLDLANLSISDEAGIRNSP